MNRLFRSLIIFITIAVSVMFSVSYSKKATVFYGDALGYYLYLPAVFIYDNLDKIEKAPAEGLSSIFYKDIEYTKSEKGYTVIQYTYGVALMEAPFFLAAHAYEKAAGLPANGYSDTYKLAVQISSFAYALLGMWLVYLVLRRYFSTTHSLLTLSFLFIGTNLFWFSLYQAGMSHTPLFFLYALLIYLTILLHERKTTMLFVLTGLTAALIALIRPSDIVCMLIPALYGIYNKEPFFAKLRFIRENFGKIVLAGFVAVIPFIPQFMYWKFISGHWFYDSYGGQTFNFKEPKIIEGLFYASNGWLVYSPIMAFAIIGFICYRSIRNWAWCIYLLFPTYVYIIYSWFCYNYINGFGSRPMIHIYPLLAIPLAAMILYISKRNIAIKSLFAILCIFFIAVNISLSMNAVEGKLKSESSNIHFNLQTLFKRNLNYTDLVVADIAQFQPDTSKIKKIAVLGCENHNDSVSVQYERDTTNPGNFFYYLPAEQEYPDKGLSIPYNKEQFKNAKWFKCTGRFKCPDHWGFYYQHLFVFEIRRGDQFLEWKGCQIDNKVAAIEDEHLSFNSFQQNKWGEVYFFVKVPDGLQEGDILKLGTWNMAKKPLYTDYFCLELYE
jgi:hypothetical protein